jgi:hypothetical protein
VSSATDTPLHDSRAHSISAAGLTAPLPADSPYPALLPLPDILRSLNISDLLNHNVALPITDFTTPCPPSCAHRRDVLGFDA